MTLRRKIKRLRALKAEVATLEREIRDEAFAATPGLLVKPRLERVMELFA